MSYQSLQLVLTIGGVITLLGLLIGAVAVLINSYRKAPRLEKSEIISSADQLSSYWEKQVDGFKKIVEDLTDKLEKQREDYTKQIKEMTEKVGVISGQLTEKEKQNKQYLDILQNRDPETKQFMEIMLKFVSNQNITNQENAKINTGIVRVLSEIHTMTKAEHDRDFKITATVTKDSDHTS